LEDMTSDSSDQSVPTATASSGPVGRPDDAEAQPGEDLLAEIAEGNRPSGHVLSPDEDDSDEVDRDSEESFPASDPPANY
jgi:hypothetical protein